MYKRSRLLLKHLLSDYNQYLNQTVKICGWIESMRSQQANGIAFISLSDGSTIKSLQIILDPQTPEELETLGTIYKDGTKGVSIEANGIIVESPANGQDIELKCTHLKVLGTVCAAEYPISKKKLTLEHIRKFPHLRIRSRTMSAIARIRNICASSTHEFYQKLDFKYVHTPIITSNDCEGAGETFNIDNKISGDELFFSKPVNLTVSGQLHGETYATALGDIYTFGPTFRAENSNTSRHLCEFWMIEPEMCFIELKDLMDVSEDYIKYCISNVLDKCIEDIEFLTKQYDENLKTQLTKIKEDTFSRMTYTEVIDRLQKEITDGKAIVRDSSLEHKKFKKLAKGKHIFEENVFWGCDLASEHEKYMTDKIINGPLFVTDYPKEIKSFYMKESEDGKTVSAMDLLVPGIGELIGGSMREENYDILKSKMDTKNIEIPWYLDIRKFGSVPHGRFGLGFERLVMLVTGIYNIRDVIPFPRYPRHCDN